MNREKGARRRGESASGKIGQAGAWATIRVDLNTAASSQATLLQQRRALCLPSLSGN
jgi:hypothetical protein